MSSTVLLQISGLSPQYTQYIMFGLIFLVFYFFMIRPQMKKQKDQKKYVEELKKGDRVVTTAGIHGKVVEIDNIYVVIEVDKSVNIKFDKSAISLEASKALNVPAKV
jgi:preprotein translocase subunit YajC